MVKTIARIQGGTFIIAWVTAVFLGGWLYLMSFPFPCLCHFKSALSGAGGRKGALSFLHNFTHVLNFSYYLDNDL